MGHFGYLVEEFSRVLRLSPRLGDGPRSSIERHLFPDIDDLWAHFDATRGSGGPAIPMLFVHDEDDLWVSLQQARLLEAVYAPHAELISTSGLGHRGILAAPAVLAGALPFLRRDLLQRDFAQGDSARRGFPQHDGVPAPPGPGTG